MALKTRCSNWFDDGFFNNQTNKILMPRPLQNVEQPLRLVGYGSQIDEFVLSTIALLKSTPRPVQLQLTTTIRRTN